MACEVCRLRTPTSAAGDSRRAFEDSPFPEDGSGGAVRSRHNVCLTAEQRQICEALLRDAKSTKPARRRALVLLHADCCGNSASVPDDVVAARSGVKTRTVRRVRSIFAQRGLVAALHGERDARRPPSTGNGQLEALIESLLASPPPPSYPRWTIRTLAEELRKMPGGVHVSRETVRIALLRRRGTECQA